MKLKINERYLSFFNELNINPKTGLLEKEKIKFETYPYIGSKYEESEIKIVFVGLDIGKEEKENEI